MFRALSNAQRQGPISALKDPHTPPWVLSHSVIDPAMNQLADSSNGPEPVIEPSNGGAAAVDLTTRALNQRIRQQEILAELGVLALQGKVFLDLLDQTARLTAEGMEAEFCKVLEYIPAENRFLVRAGVGWQEGIVGVATVGADLESPLWVRTAYR